MSDKIYIVMADYGDDFEAYLAIYKNKEDADKRANDENLIIEQTIDSLTDINSRWIYRVKEEDLL